MRKATLILATFTLAAGLPAAAQAATAGGDPTVATAQPVEQDDDDFPWGLLGLLGLAGLLGRKRDDRNDRVRS